MLFQDRSHILHTHISLLEEGRALLLSQLLFASWAWHVKSQTLAWLECFLTYPTLDVFSDVYPTGFGHLSLLRALKASINTSAWKWPVVSSASHIVL
jgi:hypothetical protein